MKETEIRNERCGTLAYMAPEILNKAYHGYASDYWSLGISLYILIFGKAPYQGQTFEEIKNQILNKEIILEDEKISQGLKKILKGLLSKDPSERFSSKEIKGTEWYKSMTQKNKEIFYENQHKKSG